MGVPLGGKLTDGTQLRAGDDDPMTRPRRPVPPSAYHDLQWSEIKLGGLESCRWRLRIGVLRARRPERQQQIDEVQQFHRSVAVDVLRFAAGDGGDPDA